MEPTNLLRVPQVKEVQIALVTHLFIGGEHYYVAAEVKATGPYSRTRLQQSKLFP